MALFVLSGVFAVWMLWMVIGWWMFGHRNRHRHDRRRHRRRGGPPVGIGGPRQYQRF
jgi:hypothetical protein